ncbi:MAG: helix-turn-helix transcriptional regulator [Lawsonibacter sp.]|jgi:transcriptional regulator with XRE-family HTH domain|nr:helix-turn-helix transcriptional regulator [Lawsonibacter sp.]
MLILAERLSLLRKERDLTQKEVGQELGISLNSYQRYETGEREPTAPVLVKMARFYHVSLDYLVGLKDERQ